MRNSSFIVRILASVVAFFYLVGVFGFDIHSSTEAQRTFIVPLFAGICCEHIHPDAPCHCDDGEGECEDHEDCCHDTIEVLDIPGLASIPSASVPAYFLTPVLCETPIVQTVAVMRQGSPRDAFFPSPPDLSLMCIMRV